MVNITANGRLKGVVPSKPLPLTLESRGTPTAVDGAQPSEPLFRPSDELRCLRQVEFYFSDGNLPFDQFLWKQHSKDGADHWVPLAVLATFNRLRGFFDTHGKEWVVAALRKSARLLEVDGSGNNVRRRPALAKHAVSGWCRSVYVKGFGRGPEFNGTLHDLHNFFTQFAYVTAVNLRREKSNSMDFKGSVFVEFADVLEAEAFVALQPPPIWNGTELITMGKQEYCLKKRAEKNLPETYHRQIPKTTDVDRYLRRLQFDAFEPDRARPPPRCKYDADEAHMFFMGTVLRVWRPKEGLPAGKKFKGDLSKWQYVKDVPLVRGATLELCCGYDFSKYVGKIKALIDRITGDQVYVDYIPRIPKHKPRRANIFFRKPVSDQVLHRLKNQISRLDNSNIRWSRIEADKEHALQLEDANKAARRAYHGLKKREPVLDYWPDRSEMGYGKVFIVTKDAARNKTPRGNLKRRLDTSLVVDAGAPAAKKVKLEPRDDAIPPSAPAAMRKRARDDGPLTLPNKKPKLELPSVPKRGWEAYEGAQSYDRGHPRENPRPFFAAMNRGARPSPMSLKRERFDDDTSIDDGPVRKRVKAEPTR
ncbi:hypothetical protein AURDEDRAFT_154585 [Auricularia subglabra TFB-10046 SS5]|nr:hypothetical protein AURDEDRAFT_154585 [Auricularia subglabra TFB-10046 SS5]